MTEIVMPAQTNGAQGVMFGGIIMQWIDVCSGVAAMRHAAGAVVTASIDRLDFISPVRLGDVVILTAQVNFAARTSMEVGCRVETEDPKTRQRRYCTRAYLTFVAVDEDGRPRPVAPIAPETDEERVRFERAEARRADRLRHRMKK
jgi:acyl-CoA hydrolase